MGSYGGKIVKYELWAWAPISRQWYRQGASASDEAGLRVLRAVVAAAAEGVRLEIRTESGDRVG